MKRAAREGAPGADETLHLERHALGQLLHGEQGPEIVGDRVKAAGVHEPRAGPQRLLVMGQPHAVHELGLTGQIDVVGAGGGAGSDQRLAVVDVGAHGGDHHLGRFGHGPQRRGVAGVGLQQRQLRQPGVDLGQPRADELELAAVAAGQSPAGIGRVAGQVLGGETAGESGRPVDDDLVRCGQPLSTSCARRIAVSRSTPARAAS